MARAASQMTRFLKRRGWRLIRNNGHEVWRCGCGKHTITVSTSPSDIRAFRNSQARAKRLCPGE